MSKLTGWILFLKLVGILKFVKSHEFQEVIEFIKFEFSIYVLDDNCAIQVYLLTYLLTYLLYLWLCRQLVHGALYQL